MSQVFRDDGNVIPVTIVKASRNIVTQIKNKEQDGYFAIQVGFDAVKKINKSKAGHLKDLSSIRTIREFRVDEKEAANFERGGEIAVDAFVVGDKVRVTGFSKGKGFQGVVKRHGFHGSPKTHGHKDQERMPGSIGATDPGRVFKGIRMGGHTGDAKITVTNLEVIDIDSEKDLIYIKGALPGARNSLVYIYGPGEMVAKKAQPVKVEEKEIVEEVVASEPSEENKTEEVLEDVKKEVETKNVEQ